MSTGLKPFKQDHRDASFPRTFGSATSFADELNLDKAFSFPDQNALGLPEACTGFTQSELCEDEDGVQYDPAYTYKKTLFMMGAKDGEPCDIRQSLKSTMVYGVQAPGETDQQAEQRRRGSYFNVVDKSDLDYFDDVRSALTINKRTISFATPWYSEWNSAGPSGILPMPWSASIGGHNLKICGWKEINGAPHLIWKTWQGPGYRFVSRETFNAIMPKSLAFTLVPYDGGYYYAVKLALLETVLSYCRALLGKLL